MEFYIKIMNTKIISLLFVFTISFQLHSQSVNFLPSEIWANKNNHVISIATEVSFSGYGAQLIFLGGTGYSQWYWTSFPKKTFNEGTERKFNFEITISENNTQLNRSSELNFELLSDGGPKYFKLNINQSSDVSTGNLIKNLENSYIYLNTVTNKIIISNNLYEPQQTYLMIIDTSGKYFAKKIISANQHFEVDVSNFPKGIYFYKYNQNNGKFILK